MTVELTSDQALVLFELLSRLEKTEEIAFAHGAEEQVLWAVHGQLQRLLVEPFRDNYLELLAAARSRIAEA